MLDLSPDEIQELEAEFARLPPHEQAMLEAAAVALERSVDSMSRRLDDTLEYLDRSFSRLRAMDFARDIFGDDFTASRWLLTPNGRFKDKTPMSVIKEDDGPARIIEHLRTRATPGFHS